MSEIVVMARAAIIDGKIDEARAAFLEAVKATHQESGCLRYALHQGLDEKNILVMMERWTSRQALDEHMATEHIQRLFATVTPLLKAPAEILVLEPLSEDFGVKGKIG